MTDSTQSASSRASLGRFADDVVSWAREARADLALLHHEAVPGSLYSGASGVSFFFLEAARLTQEDRLLEPARQWLAVAQEWATRAAGSDWTGVPTASFSASRGWRTSKRSSSHDLEIARACWPPRDGSTWRLRGFEHKGPSDRLS
jgi:hypothetical protein